jgi:Bifunctional DNA primase/polymerase, N-terminal
MTLPESALSVANAGYPILPLVPNGERRLDLGWIPTSELGRIRGQWHRTPDANIGIASDSYLVLELVLHGGPALVALGLVDGLPKTVNIRAPNYKAWLLYSLPAGVSVCGGRNLLGDGLSVKGKGAHIVAPGSVIDGQTFNWSPGHFEGRRPTVAPQWLIERCSAPREGTAS